MKRFVAVAALVARLRFHASRLFPAAFALAVLTACPGPVAHYMDTTYRYKGETYVLQEFSHGTTMNLTLFQVVDGERKFVGFIDRGIPTITALKTEEMPDDPDSIKGRMIAIIQRGEQVGETVQRDQRSIMMIPTQQVVDDLGE